MGVRTYFFLDRMVRHWSRLPGAVVESPSMERFKRPVDVTLETQFSNGFGSAGFKV